MSKMFNAIEYAKEAEKSGFSRSQADFLAASNIIINDLTNAENKLMDNELVSKSYLSSEFRNFENNIVKWMFGLLTTQTIIVLSIMNMLLNK